MVSSRVEPFASSNEQQTSTYADTGREPAVSCWAARWRDEGRGRWVEEGVEARAGGSKHSNNTCDIALEMATLAVNSAVVPRPNLVLNM